jgi:glycosidase
MLFFCAPLLPAADLHSWKDQILYFVLLDRFSNGDPGNDHDVDLRDPYAFHGGDIKGLVNRLDYLQNLGITGLWVSPIFENRQPRFFKHSSYHGYWVWDFWKPDSRFADEQDLELLQKSLKKAKMRLLLDMVVNHMGYDAPFVQANPDWFNHNGNITNWNDKFQLINHDIFGLPDFASKEPVVKTFFKLVGRHWLRKLNPDGFRLDAVKHVPEEFWQEFNQEMKCAGGSAFMLLGEYLDGNPDSLLKTWQTGGFNSMFDFPLYYTIKEVFAERQDCRKLASRLYFDRNYPDAGMLATFIDNHDLDRFMTLCGENESRYLMTMAFLMTVRGIPTLCYGDEQGLAGKESPQPLNRGDMVFDETSEIYRTTRKLIALRKDTEPLRRGLQCHLFADKTAYAFARLTPDALAVAVFNNGDQPRQIEFAFPFKLDGQIILNDRLNQAKAIVRQGQFSVFLNPETAAIFVPESRPGFYQKAFRHWHRRMADEKAWGEKRVTVKLKFDYVPEKAEVFLTGNCDELGNWSADSGAVKMVQVSDDEFEASLKLPLGKVVECKCFYRKIAEEDEAVETVWQSEDNSIFEVRENGTEFVHISWRTL